MQEDFRSRHVHTLNYLVHRALSRANIQAVKQQTGLSRSDEKRPDGISLIPWQSGRPVTWDVTVSRNLADAYLASAAFLDELLQAL